MFINLLKGLVCKLYIKISTKQEYDKSPGLEKEWGKYIANQQAFVQIIIQYFYSVTPVGGAYG